VEYDETGADAAKQASVTELLAVRIRNFGGVLRELAPAASLQRNDLRLVLCHTNRRTAYLLYVLRGLLGKKWNVPGVELVHSGKVRCQYLPRALASDQSKPQTNVYIEADGELVGTLPAEISVVPDALTLLAPSPQSAG
jgi:diacylglycerol kinase family enzyme